jgi:crotonobetainyl-CoA:carnitine CoA-transferase CaiB-like acyl-CoA transferase
MSACADADGPLQGVLVLDLVEAPLAPLGRLYADLGAQVVCVRTPDSHGR